MGDGLKVIGYGLKHWCNKQQLLSPCIRETSEAERVKSQYFLTPQLLRDSCFQRTLVALAVKR